MARYRRDRIEGYKPHSALQRDFSLKAKPFLKNLGIDYDSKGYQNDGMFKVGGNNYWFDSDEQGFFTDKPSFEGYPYDEIVDLLKDTLELDETDSDDEEDISDEERLGTGSGLKSQGDYLDSDNEEDVDMYYAINDLRKYLIDKGHATGSIKPMDFDNNMDKVRKLHNDAWLYKDNPRNADVLKKYAKKRFDSWSDWKNNNGPVPEDEELKAEYEQKFIDDWNPKRAAIFDELFDNYDSKADTRKNLLNGIQDKML